MKFFDKANYTTFQGQKIKLEGQNLDLGDVVPVLHLPNPHLEDVQVGGESNEIQVIISVPSLDTPVCAKEARKFNEALAKIEGVKGIIVSMDLPFSAALFCTTSNINIHTLSDFRNKSFAKAYGVLIPKGSFEGLCARAVFIVNKDGRLVYKQIVPEVTQEPDYAAVLKKVTAATKEGASCCGFCQ
jgi:thiol peroxidase